MQSVRLIGLVLAAMALACADTPCNNDNLGNGVICVAPASAANTTGSNITSLATASSLNVTAGDSLIGEIRYGASCGVYGTDFVVRSSAGDMFQSAGLVSQGGGGGCLALVYVCRAVRNATSTATVYFASGKAYVSIIINQYRGLLGYPNTDSCLDASSVATGTVTSGTPVTSASFNTVNTNEVSVAAGSAAHTATTYTAGPGYTLKTTDPGGRAALEHQAFTSTQTGITASMGFSGSYNGAIVQASFIAGGSHSGSGIPTGHGVLVWGTNSETATQCGAPTCIMKVTDSKGNTYTTLRTVNSSASNFLAYSPLTNSMASDGSDYITCAFYHNDGTTAVAQTSTGNCRVFDVSNAGAVDSSGQNSLTSTNQTAGALTVSGGNTDLLFAIFNLASSSVSMTAGSGYTEILNAVNGTATNYAEYREATSNATPGATASPSVVGVNLSAAISESSPGGSVSYVNGTLRWAVNASAINVQIPQWYGTATSASSARHRAVIF